VVTLSDGLCGRKDVLLGKYDTPESRGEYVRVISEWEARSRRLPSPPPAEACLSINEVALAYWQFASDYYGFERRKRTGTEQCLRYALSVIKELYGHTEAKGFGPLALKACRRHMVEMGWSRSYVNAQVDRIRRMFKWAASEELIPGTVPQNLATVEGLRKGKTEAREGKKVRPVPPEDIDATIPYLPPVIRAMVQLQLLTGCRPSEVCSIRPVDIDMRKPCWVYRPQRHKTEHHDIERNILIGPKAQEILRPYLGTKLDAYCFSPVDSEATRNAAKRAARNTPLTPSQRARKPKRNPKRPKRDRYDETSYRNAVYRACDKAFPPPVPLARLKGETRRAWLARLTGDQKAELQAWQKAHHWHPNRLRHNRATELRRHGLDVTKTILGHTKVETAQIYAEKDLAAAMELVSRIG
jgi:integrase